MLDMQVCARFSIRCTSKCHFCTVHVDTHNYVDTKLDLLVGSDHSVAVGKMRIYYNLKKNLIKSATGTPIGPGSACEVFTDPDPQYTTPPAGYEIDNEQTARYVHLLFGLRYRNLKRIDTVFVTLVYFAFVELEKEWKNLVEDIRCGTLKKGLEIPDQQRQTLLQALSPDPKRANELQTEFAKGFDGTLASRLWPKLRLISCICTGPFAHYTVSMRQKYASSEDIAIFHPMYVASEGFIGLNIWPKRKDAVYLLWPYGTFFEFIPLQNLMDDVPKTVFIDQVEIGSEYEIVLTTLAGLYRYRLGDVVRVVEFYGRIPVVEFLYRSGQLLSIKGEKVSEISLLETMNTVKEKMKTKIDRIVDFTSCESMALDPMGIKLPFDEVDAPCYVIFLELSVRGTLDAELERAVTLALDEALVASNERYQYYRKKGGLDRMKVYLVRPATFIQLRAFMLDTSTTSPNQIKIPKLLRKPQLIEFMLKQRIEYHFLQRNDFE